MIGFYCDYMFVDDVAHWRYLQFKRPNLQFLKIVV